MTKILAILFGVAALAIGGGFVWLQRYEYLQPEGGRFILRLDRWHDRACWRPLAVGSSGEYQQTLTVPECEP